MFVVKWLRALTRSLAPHIKGIYEYYKVLKMLFKFMVEEGMVTENPSKKISKII